MVLTKEDVAAIETVEHYIHDEDQCYLMLYGALSPARGGLLSRARERLRALRPIAGSNRRAPWTARTAP